MKTAVICVEQEIYYIEEDQLRSLLSKANLFSPYERNYCQKKPTPLLSIAGIWCAKQAFVKVTNQRLGFYNFNYLDLEVRHRDSGQPTMTLHDSLAKRFESPKINVEIAIAHTKTLAAATILLWGDDLVAPQLDHASYNKITS